ncbi:MAG TPA: hypothetical protein VFH74_14155 [Gaiellales bacterium]|nr:hypothetical protein [Gaiellales bacterium]
MPAAQVTADDLLPLCGTAQRALTELRQAPGAPRVRTLRRLGEFVTSRMTDAALAYERDAAEATHHAGLLDAADVLTYADALQEIGVDGRGYVGGPSAAGPVEAPGAAEREAHTRFLEAVDGLQGALRVVADELDEPPGRLTEELSPGHVSAEAIADLADEALTRLRDGTAAAPPRDADGREAAMVWLTFCGFTLDRALAAQTALDGGDDAELTTAVRALPRLPVLLRAVANPAPESLTLLELARQIAA